jgi:superfamily II DNA or RNA helicase
MTTHEAKNKIQMEALSHWKDNDYKGTINLPTGTGKTRLIAIAAGRHIEKDPEQRWLVVVPKERLRDVEIPSEFKKWGYKKQFNQGVTVECIQTACRRTNEHWDGICVDEIHRTLSPEHIKLYENNKFDKIIGLSATVEDKDKRDLLQEIAPIVYKKNTKQALDLGLISDFKVYNLRVQFTAEERKAYAKADNSFTYLSNNLGGPGSAFRRAQAILGDDNASSQDKGLAARFFNAIRKRKDLCNKAINKIIVSQQIKEMFPDRYGVFFSDSIDLADKLHNQIGETSTIYHSKLTKREKDENMKAFSDARTRVNFLCSARALNEGFNVERVSLGICGSGNSKKLDQIQQLGRTLRLQEGKVAIFVNLFVHNSQDMKWVERRTEGQNPIWIDFVEEIQV